MIAPKTQLTDAEAQRILDSIDAMTAAQSLTDAELSDAAISVVCALSQNDGFYAIIDELIKRFDKKAGVRRDEETGEVI